MQHPTQWFRLVAIGCVLGSLAWAVPSQAQDERERGAGSEDAATEDAQAPAAEEPEASAPDDTEPATGPPPGIEVMRVRGRGLADIQTEVPSSVTSFDAATIEALGAQDVSDLSRVTPNVNIVQPGSTQATFFIRGIGLSDFSSNAAGAVTIFQDDVSINAPAIQTGQLFDIEGVEILRGPQGTGPFRNASAGGIRVRSRRPTGNYSASMRLTRGRYAADGGLGARHAAIREYEGALEVPIVDEWLSSRFAFRLRDDDPWQTNGCGNGPPVEERGASTRRADFPALSVCGETGNYFQAVDPFRPFGAKRSILPAALPSDVGDQKNWAARGIFRLTPPESDWDVLLNAHGSKLNQQSTFGQAIGTSRLQSSTNTDTLGGFGGQTRNLRDFLYMEPDIVEEYFGLDGVGGRNGVGGLCQADPITRQCANPNAQAQLAANLTKRPLDLRPYRGDYNSVGRTRRDAWGGYVSAEGKLGDYDLRFLGSYDQYRRDSTGDLDFTPDQLIEERSEDEAWQTYEEVRLGGELAAAPFAWEVGGYFLYEKLEGDVMNVILEESNIGRVFEQDIYSGAFWTSFSWDFLEDLTVEGGVRLNYERKDFDLDVESTFTGDLVTEQGQTWLEPTGELILTWHLDERTRAYARYTHGFKAGHYNSLATARPEELLADNETNDAWEAGLRGAFWDQRVRLAGAFFYYLYSDYQVFLFSDAPQQPPTLEIVNAAEAELYGVELEGQLRPLQGIAPRWMEQLELTGNFSWLQGQYIDFQDELTFTEGGGFTTLTFDFSGNALANAPKYKVSAAAEWTFDFGRWGYLIPRYDLAWSDVQFFDPREGRGSIQPSGAPSLPKDTIAQPAFFLHNVRLAYRTPTGHVEVAGWVRNLTDEVYKTYAFDASRFAGVVLNFTGEPRTIGLDVVFTF